MRDTEFNDQFNTAVRRVRRNNGEGVMEEQARLRGLVPQLMTDEDRKWALEMIERFPQRAVPAPPSPWMAEALKIQDAGFFAGGTTEERIAAMVEARRQIEEIADRAPREERARIRALTRIIEHRETWLHDPPFEVEDAPPHQDG